MLSQTAYLRRSSSLFFIPLVPYPARFARHLPHAGKALSVVILFLHVSCIRFDDARKPASSYRSLPHWGRGTASAVDRVLSQTAYLRRSPSLSFIPLPSIQPPPLRGTSFHRKEGVSTRAPSLGRGCRAQRGGVGFLFCGEAASSLPFPSEKGDRAAVDRVLSQAAYLRRFLFHLYHLLETIFFALFHTASTLSGSLRSPPSPLGKGDRVSGG